MENSVVMNEPLDADVLIEAMIYASLAEHLGFDPLDGYVADGSSSPAGADREALRVGPDMLAASVAVPPIITEAMLDQIQAEGDAMVLAVSETPREPDEACRTTENLVRTYFNRNAAVVNTEDLEVSPVAPQGERSAHLITPRK